MVISREKLRWILHSDENERYEGAIATYLDEVYFTIQNDMICTEERGVPVLPSEKDWEKQILDSVQPLFHHDERSCREMARILLRKFDKKVRDKVYQITGNVSFSAGRADVGLIRQVNEGFETVIAVEVGETRADKPLCAFYEFSPLRELWVYPYDSDFYYVFMPGKNWEKYLDLRRKKERAIFYDFERKV